MFSFFFSAWPNSDSQSRGRLIFLEAIFSFFRQIEYLKIPRFLSLPHFHFIVYNYEPLSNGRTLYYFFFLPRQPLVDQDLLFIDISQSPSVRHTTLGRTPLDEWSARSRDVCLTAYNTHERHTSVSLAGFEPATPASERPQTSTLDHLATGIERCITI